MPALSVPAKQLLYGAGATPLSHASVAVPYVPCSTCSAHHEVPSTVSCVQQTGWLAQAPEVGQSAVEAQRMPSGGGVPIG